MKVHLLSVRPRKGAAMSPESQLVGRYVERTGRYAPCASRAFVSEEALLQFVRDEAGRTTPFLVLTDSTGKLLSSEELAQTIGNAQDIGTQHLMIAVGPADGWSNSALQRANVLIAFGRITLPHELALVVAAEQVYRALTIRAGHPYHVGH